ncbi:MAG: molybdopterin molybdotransferase MoeA [Thiolinea sp.]
MEQAQERILSAIHALTARERVNLHQAAGRILADDVQAGFDVPPHRNSSMDGYAFRQEGITAGSRLRVIGKSFAGRPFLEPVAAGECVRIMTGAMLPPDTDTVEMQENVRLEGEQAVLLAECAHGSNVRYPGDDLRAGDCILQQGRKLNAADLGLLASLAIGEVDVLRRPRVAFFSTGDELKPIGSPLLPGDIHDSNRYTLYAMLQKLEVEMVDMGIIPDQAAAVEQAFTDASRIADVLITSGGVSVGDADYVTATLAKLGQVNFWKMAMKPGKPFAHGRLGNCLFFGLPGNPVSVMATFLLFVRPAILKLRGEAVPVLQEQNAIALTPLKKTPGRKDYQRGICARDAQGHWQVSSTGKQESHMLRSMSQANCFIVLARDSGDMAAGSHVSILPFSELL